MYQYQVNRCQAYFDLKTDPGGITDIEFIVQYLVLRYCADNIALSFWSDNVRIFTLLAEYALMSAEETQQLKCETHYIIYHYKHYLVKC